MAIFEGEDSIIDPELRPGELWNMDTFQAKLLCNAPAQHYKTRNRTIQLKIVQLSQGIAPIYVSLTDNTTIIELKGTIREKMRMSETRQFNLYKTKAVWGVPTLYGSTTKWPLERKEKLADEAKTLEYYNILTDSTIDIEFV